MADLYIGEVRFLLMENRDNLVSGLIEALSEAGIDARQL